METTQTSAPTIRQRTHEVKGAMYTRFDVDFGSTKGKRIRKTYKTEAKARRAIREWNQRQKVETEKQKVLGKRIGQFAAKLNNDDLLDAAQGLDILKRSATLAAAATFWMQHNNPTGGKLTVLEALPPFLESRQERGCRPVTVRSYKDNVTAFANQHGDKPLAQITVPLVETWLRARSLKLVTRASVMRNLGAFFSWATERRYMAENPISMIGKPRLDSKPITYLTPDEVARLLNAAQEHDHELVPYVAIGVFAGLRPVEMHGEKTDHPPLDWKHIDLARGKITVAPAQDKNRRGRYVEICHTLAAWLLPHQRPAGPIVYTRARFENIVKRSGITYHKDIMRHTAGTMHYAMHQNEGTTAVLLGDTIATVKKHYINPMVDKAEAVKFYAIRPDAEHAAIRFEASA